MKPPVFNHQQYTDLEADYMILEAENERLRTENARLAVHGGKYIEIADKRYEMFEKATARAEKAESELAATKRLLDRAVEDFTSAAHNGNILCEFCGADCIDAGNDTGGDTCQCGGFEWRGAKGGAE